MAPNSKKQKVNKYLCRYNAEWKNDYSVLEVKVDPYSFYCIPC